MQLIVCKEKKSITSPVTKLLRQKVVWKKKPKKKKKTLDIDDAETARGKITL